MPNAKYTLDVGPNWSTLMLQGLMIKSHLTTIHKETINYDQC
jgi:hypothetical protein